ncbi:hypothetical protein [Streptomyces sp. NPDC057293]|uniref:hypothetical protein n=1 Tax=unclassified Streptomyces TaxID=2593676 RepID=UPI003635A677
MSGRDEHGRLVSDGELVVLGGYGAMPLEPVDPALDRMAFAVVDWVEMRRPAAAGTELPTVARLVGLVRDGAAVHKAPDLGPGDGVRDSESAGDEAG